MDFCLLCVASTAKACGQLALTVIIYYCAEVLSSRKGRLLRIWSDQAAMTPYEKGKGLGRRKQLGLGTGVCCHPLPSLPGKGSPFCPVPGTGTAFVCGRVETPNQGKWSRQRAASQSPGSACVQAQVGPGLIWPERCHLVCISARENEGDSYCLPAVAFGLLG